MIIDCHVHLTMEGPEACKNVEDVLRAMDEAGIDRIFLFSSVPRKIEVKNKCVIYKESKKKQRESIEKVAEVVAKDPERLMGFAWIDPCLPDAEDEVERAIVDYKLRGIKMIPYHWYPYEERIFPVYAKIQEMKVPIIFHSGISFTGGDCSRFCRPVFYEVLLHFPKIKFALAHIGFPWVDECIATAWRFQAAATMEDERYFRFEVNRKAKSQMYIDITPGTPLIYRTEALRKAVNVLGEDRLIYGSDTVTILEMAKLFRNVLENDKRRLREELAVSKEAEEKIMGKNAMALLEVSSG